MNWEYVFSNTLMYGYIALLIASIFAYKRYINFGLPSIFLMFAYSFYDFYTFGFSWRLIFFFISILVFYFLLDLLIYKSFIESKKRELFSIIFTLGFGLFSENFIAFIYGGSVISIKSDILFSPYFFLGILIFLSVLIFYLLRFSFTGKVFLGLYENENTMKSIGVSPQRFLSPYLIFLFITGFFLAIIALYMTTFRPTDGLFYLIKGLGIMVLVGLVKIEYTFFGALFYVLLEYFLFIKLGIEITYKESLILFIILFLLIFKPEGIFTKKLRKL